LFAEAHADIASEKPISTNRPYQPCRVILHPIR
jgi:hypothetical protein